MKLLFTASALAVLALCANALSQAQLARKPSFYEQQQKPVAAIPNALAPTSTVPAAPEAVKLTAGFLPAIKNRTDFERLARVYDPGTPMEMAHALFVIDLHAKPARMYYVDTPRFNLHLNFLKRMGLTPSASEKTLNANYLKADRRFLLGTISWQTHISAFTYEFWEGDQITPALLAKTEQMVSDSFFERAIFKTNSTLHERRAKESDIEFISQETLIREQPFMALNTGSAIGRLRILNSEGNVNALLPQDIVLLRHVPLSLPPVAGILTDKPSTMLSHVNLLAKGWGIPNAYVRDAVVPMRQHEGQWVELKVTHAGYQVRRLTPSEVVQHKAYAAAPVQAVKTPKPDLRERRMLPMAQLRAGHSDQCGAKAANLGAVQAARIVHVQVPDGFCIPFAHYDHFMKVNGLPARLAQMQMLPGFATDPMVRKTELARLRGEIVRWPVDTATALTWRAQWKNQLSAQGVFVRSSSNSEDLPGFSGAGLYSTVANVKTPEALDAAIKTVWASVFNPEAWESRRVAGFNPEAVYMSVLVQSAVDATNAGVMITRDPFDASPNRWHVTYLSAKRGIGIRVVEGQRLAEQVMYSSWSKAVQVVSRSADNVALQLDTRGGVKEVPVEVGRVVLTDALVVKLAQTGAAIKSVFRGVNQDIEWATVNEKIVILQARPYVDGAVKNPP